MRLDVRRFLSLRRVTGVAPSPGGDWLAVAVEEAHPDGGRWVSHLWRVPLAPGEAPRQLTTGDHRDGAPRFLPDGTLTFLSNRDTPPNGPDPEVQQVWTLREDRLARRTDEPLGVLDARFAPSGLAVLLAPRLPGVPEGAQHRVAGERARNGPSALSFRRLPVRHWDRWFGPEAPHFVRVDGGRLDLTPEAERTLHDVEWDLSPDGKRIAYTPARYGPDQMFDRPLAVLDTRSGRMRLLDASPRTTHASPRWSPDGTRIASCRHRREPAAHGPKELCITDAASGEVSVLAAEWDRWPVPAAWTPDGHEVIVTAADRGTVGVFAVEVTTGAVRRIVEGGGSHEQVHVAGDHVIGLHHAFLQPPEPFATPLTGGPLRLLATLSGTTRESLEEIAEVTWREVPVSGSDPVHTAVVRPRNGSAGGAGLLWVHGGPVSQWADAWHWRWNPLPFASAGYTVALPNPRGSTGYGRAWVEAIWGNAWGTACFSDLEAAAASLRGEPDVDPARLGLMGGSFGGWMVNELCARTDLFACSVAHASIFEHQRMYGDCDSPGEWAWHIGSTPDGAPEDHDRFSPHRFADQWTAPVLIIHGEKDYCVPISQALALFGALQSRGVPSELLVFPDEGHWILKPNNVAAWHDAILAFLAGHLPRSASP